MQNNQKQHVKPGGFHNRLFKLKLLAAIWSGKILIALTRVLGRGGTTLPGRAALRIAPRLLSSLSAPLPQGSLIVTGTNGKTTTSALITAILKNAGYRCINNQSGSNMSWGVASALLAAVSWTGHLPGNYAVMEVDEGAFPGVVSSIKPRGVVITNVFRDQLDRYGEVDHVLDAIKKGLEMQPEGCFEVINADDPSLAGIALNKAKKRWTYGLELDLPAGTFENTGRDMKTCPICTKKLNYDKIYFAHLGHYHCLSCGYRRQDPDVKLTGSTANPDGSSSVRISLPGENIAVNFHLMGTYNLYNLLAAVTCARALDISTTAMRGALEQSTPSFGRMEIFKLENKTIVMALIKNPVGANEVLRTILAQKNRINILVAINDKIADGTDVSWLWDVDFEQLVSIEDKLSGVMVSGLRAREMAVRFKYAGLDTARIGIEENTAAAIGRALEQTSEGSRLFILPTYTAMLEMRRTLNKMGLGKPYWEE